MPGAELFLAMGSDKVLQLLDPKWYEDRERTLDGLFAEARVLYAARAGDQALVAEALAAPQNRRWRDRFERLEVAPEAAAVSSRMVRELIRKGSEVGHLVPPEVRPFVAQ